MMWLSLRRHQAHKNLDVFVQDARVDLCVPMNRWGGMNHASIGGPPRVESRFLPSRVEPASSARLRHPSQTTAQRLGFCAECSESTLRVRISLVASAPHPAEAHIDTR